MASDSHKDPKFQEKKKPKNPISFRIPLNEEQKEAKSQILKSAVSVIDGKAGSGKTTLAAQIALDLLFTRQIEQIIIARPFITAGEDIGFLPGGVDQKLEFLTFPIYDLMEGLTGSKEKVQSLTKEGKIKVIPLGFLRGFTFTDSVIIIDEAQNCTKLQTELILGRLGLNSKLIFCGDKAQCDLKIKMDSGLNLLHNLSKNIDDVSYIKLIQNHRHKIVDDIFNYIRDNNL